MLSRVLWGWMLFEVLLLGALGRFALGGSWLAALGLALGAMLAVRALMMGVTWFMAWRFLSPAPALTPGATVAMVWREVVVFMLGFCIIQPFVRAWMAPDRLRSCAMPVLLVHGYGCNRGIWWWMWRQLEADGQVVATLSLEPPWGGIDEFAQQLHERVDAVCAATGAPRVLLVAHSMGGLVSRAYMARYGAARVAGLVTIATPHGGTAIARLGLGRCARQMELQSSWLAGLSPQRVTVPFVSIRTPQDNFVMPQDTQCHPDAVDEPLPGVGHMAALFDHRALAFVRQHLAGMSARA